MNFALVAIVLALIWAAITGGLSLLNLLLGGVISVFALLIMRERMTTPFLFKRFGRLLRLASLFFAELFLSALRVALLVISPNIKARLRPGIIAFPLSVKTDAEITLLANLITLTPGTLSIDVSEDRKFLYVHAIDVPDKAALIRDIANGFELRISEVFK